MRERLPNVVVTNLHKRFTGVSATVLAVLPEQRRDLGIAVIDRGGLGLANIWPLRRLILAGFRRPENAQFRVLHARRDIDMLLGIVLRSLPGQRWRLVFTTAANRKPGVILGPLINAMDGVVAASEQSARFVPWHTEVIHHGVDTDFFRPPANAPPPSLVIGYAGRIRPSKGADLFVKAMIRLLPFWPGYSAELAGLCRPGDSGFKTGLQDMITASGLGDRIRFLGHASRSDMLNLYRRMVLCVTPSRTNEGFGLVPFEALACGVPVVTSDASSAWVRFIDNEIGSVAARGDEESLTNAVSAMLSRPDLDGMMRRAARDRAVRCHSIRSEAAALNRIYKQLMRGDILPKLTSADL